MKKEIKQRLVRVANVLEKIAILPVPIPNVSVFKKHLSDTYDDVLKTRKDVDILRNYVFSIKSDDAELFGWNVSNARKEHIIDRLLSNIQRVIHALNASSDYIKKLQDNLSKFSNEPNIKAAKMQLSTFKKSEKDVLDRDTERKERMLRELHSDLADLAKKGLLTEEEVNEWLVRKQDQWFGGDR